MARTTYTGQQTMHLDDNANDKRVHIEPRPVPREQMTNSFGRGDTGYVITRLDENGWPCYAEPCRVIEDDGGDKVEVAVQEARGKALHKLVDRDMMIRKEKAWS